MSTPQTPSSLNLPTVPKQGEFLLYAAEDGKSVIRVQFHQDSVWLSQKQMAELFQIRVPTLNAHLRNIFDDGELAPEAVIRNYLTTATYELFAVRRREALEIAGEEESFKALEEAARRLPQK